MGLTSPESEGLACDTVAPRWVNESSVSTGSGRSAIIERIDLRRAVSRARSTPPRFTSRNPRIGPRHVDQLLHPSTPPRPRPRDRWGLKPRGAAVACATASPSPALADRRIAARLRCGGASSAHRQEQPQPVPDARPERERARDRHRPPHRQVHAGVARKVPRAAVARRMRAPGKPRPGL